MAAPNLAWGGFANGQIPLGNLTQVQPNKYLQKDAARTWKQFASAFKARWGEPLYLADYQDAYRDIPRQQAMYQRYLATGIPKNGVASPGYSIHGWARSVDCSGYGASGSARHNWMRENGPRYYWSWDYGRSLNESWHWDYVGPITTTSGGDVEPIEPEEPEEPEPQERDKMSILLKKTSTQTRYVYDAWNLKSIPASKNNTFELLLGTPIDVVDGQLASIDEWVTQQRTALINEIAAAIIVQSGQFTATDRAMLDDIASKGELTQALTSTVALVNEHADENKTEIIDAIGNAPGGANNFSITLEGTASPSA